MLGLAVILLFVSGSLNSVPRIHAPSYSDSGIRGTAVSGSSTRSFHHPISPAAGPCAGDINSDGRVDFVDLSLMYAAFGSRLGNPNYNPAADFNHDGLVDIADLTVVSSNFGCGISQAQPSIIPSGVQVMLDAKNTGQTDVDSTLGPNKVESLNTVGQTFRVGVVVNASSTIKIPGVYVWQFVINHNSTILVPLANPNGGGGPTCSSYPDCADNTAYLGAQTSNCPFVLPTGSGITGGCNWNSLQATSQVFSSVSVGIPTPGAVLVGFTFTLSHPPPPSTSYGVTINQKTLLASVAFELIKQPSPNTTPLSLSLIEFTDSNGNPIGTTNTPQFPDTITISDAPPVASFTAAPLPFADPSCRLVTGSPCTPQAFKFDGSASTDSDGFICAPVGCTSNNAAGYYWDWGDGTQDFTAGATLPNCVALMICNQGVIAIHDFGYTDNQTHGYPDTAGLYANCQINGSINPTACTPSVILTLRVVDNSGNTGAARSRLSTVIVDAQPSHTAGSINLHFLQGDVNDDCKVDIADLQTVGAAFGSVVGPPPSGNWNPKADLTYDAIVDIADLARVGAHFGNVCP